MGDAKKIRTCAAGPEAFDVLFSDRYGVRIMAAINRLRSAGFPDHIAMPWVFLDGELLQCANGSCTHIVHAEGVEPLPEPGSILHVVCSKLNPRPMACVGGSTAKPATVKVSECLNCAAVGMLSWHHEPWHRSNLVTVLGLGMMVFALLVTIGAVAQVVHLYIFRRHTGAERLGRCSDDDV